MIETHTNTRQRRCPPLRPLTTDEQALVMQWQGLAKKEANKAARYMAVLKVGYKSSLAVSVQYYNDLFQAANLGLIIAAQRYDPSTGYQFSTYAFHWVRHEIQIAQWRQLDIRFSYNKRRVQLFSEMSQHLTERRGEGNSHTFEIWNDTGEESYYDDTDKAPDELLCLLHLCLNERQERIVTRYVLESVNFREIGEDEGVSKQRIEQLYKHALKRLRNNAAFMKALNKQWKRRQLAAIDFFGLNIATKIA